MQTFAGHGKVDGANSRVQIGIQKDLLQKLLGFSLFHVVDEAFEDAVVAMIS